ncbi:MAG TPA: alpha/beta hydrolase [Acidimicrobiales bacterium]
MPWLLLAVGVVAVTSTANALWPRRGRWSLGPSFLASWVTIELALHWLAVLVAVGAVAVLLGGADHPAGVVGLVLAALAAGGLVVVGLQGRRTVVQVRDSLQELELAPDAPRFPRSHLILPVLVNHRRGVRQVRNIEFARVAGRRLRLDLTLPVDAAPGDRRPVVLQIHGGAWVFGDKREQGRPLLNHLAVQGWVGVNANYRLSPGATFPDHLVDCKRALAWIRAHVAEWGGDPDFVAVTGGSAGGHLAALVALTAGDPRYQPGFEDVDTSVRAAVPFYGAYDFTNRLGTWPDTVRPLLLEPWVMKAFYDEDPERFAEASPIDRVHAGAPPFMVVHGDRDTLCPVEDARLFVERLRAVSRQPVVYAEMKGAQHAFEIFPSVRAARAIEGAAGFLAAMHARRGQAPPAKEAEAEQVLTDRA